MKKKKMYIDVDMNDNRDMSPIQCAFRELQIQHTDIDWSDNVFDDLWGSKSRCISPCKKDCLVKEFLNLYSVHTRQLTHK